jgi:hypothetical protein
VDDRAADRYRQIAYAVIRDDTQREVLRLRVISNSMRPLLRSDDTICVRPIDPDRLRRGQIAVVQRNGELITHRLVAFEGAEWRTLGDNAVYADGSVQASDILGWVVAVERGLTTIDFSSGRWMVVNRWLGRLGYWRYQLARVGQGAGSRVALWLTLPLRLTGRLMVTIALKWPG